ncbi:MAG: SsrA-binding protein SmpB [Elusimicrobia bacterium]|nr:SsrA-binding protein SmpB [Elusimicrobiota bacterium]
MPKKASIQVVATNRKARYRYQIEDTLETGVSLKGSEVKSIRMGQISLAEGYIRFEGEQAYLCNVHIAPYKYDHSRGALDSRRTRKLLLHKAQIRRWMGRFQQKGFSVVPLQIYLKNGWAKLEIGLGRGKKGPDRREEIRRRETAREIRREFKGRLQV